MKKEQGSIDQLIESAKKMPVTMELTEVGELIGTLPGLAASLPWYYKLYIKSLIMPTVVITIAVTGLLMMNSLDQLKVTSLSYVPSEELTALQLDPPVSYHYQDTTDVPPSPTPPPAPEPPQPPPAPKAVTPPTPPSPPMAPKAPSPPTPPTESILDAPPAPPAPPAEPLLEAPPLPEVPPVPPAPPAPPVPEPEQEEQPIAAESILVAQSNMPPAEDLGLDDKEVFKLKRVLLRNLKKDGLIQNKSEDIVLVYDPEGLSVNGEDLSPSAIQKYTTILGGFGVDPAPHRRIHLTKKYILVGDFLPDGFTGVGRGKDMNLTMIAQLYDGLDKTN